MSADYLPPATAGFRDWLQNLITNGPAKLLALGWPQARVDAFLALLTPVHDAADTELKAESALAVASAEYRELRAETVPAIREAVQGIKNSPGYDDGVGTLLGLIGTVPSIDPNTYRPELQARPTAQGVQLSARKHGAASLNVYLRRKGGAEWQLLVGKRMSFPYLDNSPAVTPGVPEEREYRAIGVKGDEEFGQPSEIVSTIWHE